MRATWARTLSQTSESFSPAWTNARSSAGAHGSGGGGAGARSAGGGAPLGAQ
jgi:hypothetical protein